MRDGGYLLFAQIRNTNCESWKLSYSYMWRFKDIVSFMKKWPEYLVVNWNYSFAWSLLCGKTFVSAGVAILIWHTFRKQSESFSSAFGIYHRFAQFVQKINKKYPPPEYCMVGGFWKGTVLCGSAATLLVKNLKVLIAHQIAKTLNLLTSYKNF